MHTQIRILFLSAILLGESIAAAPGADVKKNKPAWKSLPEVKPTGVKVHTGAYVVRDRATVKWKRPPFFYNESAATGRKRAKVIVLIYDPVLESEQGQSLTSYLRANDSVEFSNTLVNVVREASWGYINYEVVDVLRKNAYTRKVDGFRYTDETYLEARRTQKWQSAITSYRALFEENHLIERCRREQITEVWLWGATGMHFDEFAGYIPNRYARFGPTDNPWFYRPYDIPEEIGHTMWVMGFNYEVGVDNMVHSYVHRVESMLALAVADGCWDTQRLHDPWNVFSRIERDRPGSPCHVGNCHFPPNAQKDYDYSNPRRVLSWADNWRNYPDLRGDPRLISSNEWGNSQFGYLKWFLEHLPKYPGYTEYGYNNWWIYVANPDEDLPDLDPPHPSRVILP